MTIAVPLPVLRRRSPIPFALDGQDGLRAVFLFRQGFVILVTTTLTGFERIARL